MPEPTPDTAAAGPVLLLAGPGDTTDIVAHYLADRVDDLVVVVEAPPSRQRMATRRAQRVGWPAVVGQTLFAAGALPWLRRRGDERIRDILAADGIDATPYGPVRHVPSVNAPETIALLQAVQPSVVVVQGTRIISTDVLTSIACPFINTHAGITPRYRGVHGGYWALAEGRPDLVGTTVHLVDKGIDTGGVLAQATFAVTPEDTVATYPYLHLVAGLPLLADQVRRVLDGSVPAAGGDGPVDGVSRLYLHPTLWGYLARRWTAGVR